MSEEALTVQFDGGCELGSPPSLVFAFLADHAGLPRWIPGLRRVEVDDSRASTPGGVGTRRTLLAVAGPPGIEVVTAFEPPARLVYSATDDSLRRLCTSHSAELSCTSSERGTWLRWTVRARPGSSWWSRLLARLVFQLACRAALRRLRRRFPLG